MEPHIQQYCIQENITNNILQEEKLSYLVIFYEWEYK